MAEGQGQLPPAGPVPGMPGLEHGYAEVNGTQAPLRYRRQRASSRAAARLAVHLGIMAQVLGRKLMPLLVRAGFTEVAPDLRGLGDSAKAESGYSKTNVAKDVHELVHHLGHQEIKLVGTDIGTMVAYAYAASYQAEVRRLVLSESVLPGFGLEELMNPATGGYWHFGFHMQVTSLRC